MSDITWQGVIAGFVVAGIIGYVGAQILFHTDTVGRFSQPQAIVHLTSRTPAQIFWAAVRSVFSLFVIISSGVLAAFLAYVMVSQGMDDLLLLVILEVVLFVVTLTLAEHMPFLLILALCVVQALVIWYVYYNWDVLMGSYQYY